MTAYTTGTITLTNGSTAVTGTGTGWQAALIAGGVIYPQAAGNPLPIASVDGNAAITAATAWVGESGTYAYALQRHDDANQVIANAVALADYIRRLNDPALAALSGLTPAEDKLPYFNGAGSAGLTALTDYGRSLLAAANASTALTTLGVSDFARTLLDDADAGAALTTLGVSAFAKTLLDDGDAGTALSTLGVSAFAKTLLDDADAAAARTTLGAQAALGFTPANAANIVTSNTILLSGWLGGGSQYRTNIVQFDDGSGSVRAALYAYEAVGNYDAFTVILSAYGASQGWDFRANGSFVCPGVVYGSSKNFLIDHPLDPFNKDLVFASTESPHYGVEAWGVVRLADGRATVDIDAASNLTTGTWAALTQNTIVTALQNQEGFARLRPGTVEGGSFEIIAEDDACSDLIAWHVVADRADPVTRTLANADPTTGLLIPEIEKEDAI